MKKVGLRIDVDTWYGTKYGVPCLLDILDKYQMHGTFFFSMGPDNMGKHIWRLIKPKFLYKILRSNGISIYGWKILLSGVIYPGKYIGHDLANIIKDVAAIHKIGVHAWDHYAWQTWIKYWKEKKITEQINLAYNTLYNITKKNIQCSASAGWRINDLALRIKQLFNFNYNSDCRGTHLFRPLLDNKVIGTVQIPVTLPTWDEAIGRIANNNNYNLFIINKMKRHQTPIYTIHAEVEGTKLFSNFKKLLYIAKQEGIKFYPLCSFLPKDINSLPIEKIVYKNIPGREGWVSCQSSLL